MVAVSFEACVGALMKGINAATESFWLACLNPHSAAIVRNDIDFDEALKAADYLVPDGTGIVLASRILGGRIRKRITGSDVFRGVNEAMNRQGQGSCFFLGATDETLAAIRMRMAVDFPNVIVAGTYSPPYKNEFSEEDNRQMIEAINKAMPDVLWVGMTAPKQEKWIYQNKQKLNVKFIGAVGGVFDFYSGNIRRNEYPWFLEHGLEWLPRLIQEPGRLWKRTFISAPLFLVLVLKQKFLSK